MADVATPSQRVRERLAALDWRALGAELDARGCVRLPRLLTPDECAGLRTLYGERSRFRKHVDLGAHGFGDRGDYRYFARPLPPLVQALRVHLYARLAPVANRWQARWGREQRYPLRLAPFLAHCHAAGQERPTPLVLRYDEGGYNRLHQDLYGAVAFPLQVVCLLSRPSRDFAGGEFLLTEQRPRMQSRGEAIALAEGEALVFANSEWPVEGARGIGRAQVRHGVSTLHRGERFSLGIIFHDAK